MITSLIEITLLEFQDCKDWGRLTIHLAETIGEQCYATAMRQWRSHGTIIQHTFSINSSIKEKMSKTGALGSNSKVS